ncbi:MAG: hypothetical protein P0S94_05565, partial [Simkaniaceae bacterium]|nr:hypothetical protein [Simkaniaceae bacterium]
MSAPTSGTPSPANNPANDPTIVSPVHPTNETAPAAGSNTSFLVVDPSATLSQDNYRSLFGSIGLLPSTSDATPITSPELNTPNSLTLSLSKPVNQMISLIQGDETPTGGSPPMLAGFLEGMLSGLSQLAPNSTAVTDAVGNINSMLNADGVTPLTPLTSNSTIDPETGLPTGQLQLAVHYLSPVAEEDTLITPKDVMNGYSAITGDLLKFASLPSNQQQAYIPEIAGVLTAGSMASGYMGPGLSSTFNTVIQLITNQQSLKSTVMFYSYYLNALGFNELDDSSSSSYASEGIAATVASEFSKISGKPYAKDVESGILSGLTLLDPMTSTNGTGSSWGDSIYSSLKKNEQALDLYGRQEEEYDMETNPNEGMNPEGIIPNMTPPEDQPPAAPLPPAPTPPELISGLTMMQNAALQPAQISGNNLLAFADAASNMAAVGSSSDPGFVAGLNMVSTAAINVVYSSAGESGEIPTQGVMIKGLANDLNTAEMGYVSGDITPLNNTAAIETMGTVLNNKILTMEVNDKQEIAGLISPSSVFTSIEKGLSSKLVTASNYQNVLLGVSGALASFGAIEGVTLPASGSTTTTTPQQAYGKALQTLSSLATATPPDFATAMPQAQAALATMAQQVTNSYITVGSAMDLGQAMFGTASTYAGQGNGGMSFGYYMTGVAFAGANILGMTTDPKKAFGSMTAAIDQNYETMLNGSGTAATVNELQSNLSLLSQDVNLYQTSLQTGNTLMPKTVDGTAVIGMYGASIYGAPQSDLNAYTNASLTILTMLKNSMDKPPATLTAAVTKLQNAVDGSDPLTTAKQLSTIVASSAKGLGAVDFNVFVNIAQVATMQAEMFLPTESSAGDPAESLALMTFVQDLTVAPKSGFPVSNVLKKHVSTLAT